MIGYQYHVDQGEIAGFEVNGFKIIVLARGKLQSAVQKYPNVVKCQYIADGTLRCGTGDEMKKAKKRRKKNNEGTKQFNLMLWPV